MDQTLPKLDQFLAELETAIADGTLVRVSLRNSFGADETLKSIDIKPVSIRGELKLGFTLHHLTRDLIQNHPPAGAIGQLRKLLTNDFRQGFLYATTADLLYDTQGKAPKLNRMPPSSKGAPTLEHDRTKKRLVPAGKSYLAELGVTDAEGNVLKTSGDKFRQINRYVEILAPLLKAIPPERMRRILDMGAGKGYLTFAVADYVANTLKRETDVVGVEFRDELVNLCNDIAERSELEHLSFSAGSIENFDSTGADVLIALHACDTATDDAIAKGIAAESELIVVAPCCHKQIRREMETANHATDLDFVTRHGIFMEREAEMVTDAMRAMILEYYGYSTKVFEFIGTEHTPKNVLIVGQKTRRGKDVAQLKKFNDAKAYFGIRRHYLEDAVGLEVNGRAT